MTKESIKHRKIREDLLKMLDGKGEVHTSHDNGEDIDFFREINGKKIHLAEPDIVFIKGGRILVVEIESDDSPKHLLGVAFAVNSAEKGYYANKDNDIKKKSLLLVLISSSLGKKRSRKTRQIPEMKLLVNICLNFEYFNIVTVEKVSDAILEWEKQQ